MTRSSRFLSHVAGLRGLSRFRWMGLALSAGLFIGFLWFLRFVIPNVANRLHAWRMGSVEEVEVIDAEFGTVYSRIRRETAEQLKSEFAAFFRAFLADFGPRFGLDPIELDDLRIRLDLWDRHEELAKYYQTTHYEDFSNNGGYYDSSSRTIAIVARGDYEKVRRSAFHEATHLVFDVFASRRGGRFPLWLAEGLAVYFESAAIHGGRAEIGGRARMTPVLIDTASSAVENDGFPSLNELLRAGSAEFRSESNVVYYAQSLLLVHYLMEEAGIDVRTGFLSLCRDHPERIRTVSALARSLDLTESQLREGFEGFIQGFLG